ncbi:MAG: zinc-binding dehydrogenase, partial [Caulobacteraceae bacterium]|nr:zinc-binding dehydrogenase [Caulobacteraceae bacterium]
AGKIRPQIDKVFALAEAAQAHAYLEGGAHVGKVMLKP